MRRTAEVGSMWRATHSMHSLGKSFSHLISTEVIAEFVTARGICFSSTLALA